MDGGTTKASGWAVFWFLLGFTLFGSAAIGGGPVALISGAAVIVFSAVLFKSARQKEAL